MAGIAAVAAGRRSRDEEERKGEGRKLTGGTQSSARAKKRKRERWRGPARGGAGGPAGRLGRKVRRDSFVYFSFSFSNLFQFKLFFSNSNQILSNFFKNFINFLEVTQATKSYAK
jgi:hypothetical protein